MNGIVKEWAEIGEIEMFKILNLQYSYFSALLHGIAYLIKGMVEIAENF